MLRMDLIQSSLPLSVLDPIGELIFSSALVTYEASETLEAKGGVHFSLQTFKL